jgi:hypothetical protein
MVNSLPVQPAPKLGSNLFTTINFLEPNVNLRQCTWNTQLFTVPYSDICMYDTQMWCLSNTGDMGRLHPSVICNKYSCDLMFCWSCIIVYQYSETNVTHLLFNLLSIKGPCMFRALLAHPQEVLHKPHLVYCVCVMSVGCYTKWRVCSASWGWASSAENM